MFRVASRKRNFYFQSYLDLIGTKVRSADGHEYTSEREKKLSKAGSVYKGVRLVLLLQFCGANEENAVLFLKIDKKSSFIILTNVSSNSCD